MEGLHPDEDGKWKWAWPQQRWHSRHPGEFYPSRLVHLLKECKLGHPNVVNTIKNQLTFLHERGAPVNLLTTCATIVSTILHKAPGIFEQTFKDGSKFCASDSFVQKFLHGTMSWSVHHATQATQKLLKDREDQCKKSFF